jgi:hypothetical protein
MKKFIKNLMGLTASLVMAGALSPVLAQTAATPAATPAATAAATPAPPTVVMDGMVEGYYTYNFTNAANKLSGAGNTGYYYDSVDNTYSLGLAELKTTATQGLASGHLVLAYGQELNPNGPLVASPGFDVEQAYVSYAPGQLTLSGGRFVTWMGNEVIETTGNWNVSRSLLFVYTIPLWHNGVSVAWAPDSTFKLTGYGTNGWNNSLIAAPAPTETFGLSLAWTPANSAWTITLNGVDGPGSTTGSATFAAASSRYVGEAIIGYTPNSSWSFALDAEAGGADGIGTADFWGADLYAKYALSSDYSVALRLEEAYDDGGTLGLYGSAFAKTEGREATLTITHNLTAAFTVSLEGRYDYALVNGTQVSEFDGGLSKDQLTTTLDTAIVF